MASSHTSPQGIISWVNGIRTTMTNDPGRHVLEQQIQNNGFLFLDEYLENILSGPKQQPMIELLKTPGRRKNLPSKTRAATATVERMKSVMAHANYDDVDKENDPVSPIKQDHANVLSPLQAKVVHSQKPSSSKPPSQRNVTMENSTRPLSTMSIVPSPPEPPTRQKVVIIAEDDDESADEDIVEKIVTPPRPLAEQGFLQADTSKSFLPVSGSADAFTELSVIAEEPTRTMSLDGNAQAPLFPEHEPEPAVEEPVLDRQSSTEAYASAVEDLPEVQDMPPIDDMTQVPQAYGQHEEVEHAAGDKEDMELDLHHSHTTSSSADVFHSVTLDSPIAEEVRPHIDTLHLKDLSPMYIDETIPLPPADVPEAESTQKLNRKGSMPFLPQTIGEPSPLRKSMRVPSEAHLGDNEVQQGSGPKLTRSSWLVKAREAKAMESKRTSALPPAHAAMEVPVDNSLKRKSSELFANLTQLGTPNEEQNVRKVQKLNDVHQSAKSFPPVAEKAPVPASSSSVADLDDPDTVIDRLKKTVEDYSARAGKSMGKSFGGGSAVAVALAEAKAAAEAKVAERMAAEGRTGVLPPAPSTREVADADKQDVAEARPEPSVDARPEPVFSRPSRATGSYTKRSPRVTDLVHKFEAQTLSKGKQSLERVFFAPPKLSESRKTSEGTLEADASTSTTPPNSPPRQSLLAQHAKESKPPPLSTFLVPALLKPLAQSESLFPSSSLLENLGAFSQSSKLSSQPSLLSTHSSVQSLFDNETPTWLGSTQDTEYTVPDGSQPSQDLHKADAFQGESQDPNVSWHLDKKFVETPGWTPVVPRIETNEAWPAGLPSNRPSHISMGDERTQDMETEETFQNELLHVKEAAPSAFEIGSDMETDMDVDDLDSIVPSSRSSRVPRSTLQSVASSSNADLVENATERLTESQASSSQLGFIGVATKFVSSYLGGGKKAKPEPVKSLQLAAAAAKKDQEEKEKKANRLKEMEARRQQALKKRADDEKAREEKRVREEKERYRRDKEKEDNTERRALKSTMKKPEVDDDNTKKRALPATQKAQDLKKSLLKDKKEATTSRIGKPPGLEESQPPVAKSVKQTEVVMEKSVKLVSTSSKTNLAPEGPSLKAKGKAKATDLDGKQPSQVVAAQMQARVQAHLDEQRAAAEPEEPAEPIELPDINSEYSDSEDEDRERYQPPEWAKSPNLREALEEQSTFDPDDIFGAIKPLNMQELFKTRATRFRNRTSSANWAGTDELTSYERKEYAKKMGYKKLHERQ